MDIFDVWEVLRVEGERLSRFSLLSLSQTLTDTGVSRGLASRRNPKRKWRFGDSTRQGRGQILIPPCLEIGTATQLGPIRTQKKIPEHDFEIRLQILREKLEKEVCAPFGGTYGTELVLL